MSAYSVPERNCALHNKPLQHTLNDPYGYMCLSCREQLKAADELAKAANDIFLWAPAEFTPDWSKLLRTLENYEKLRGGSSSIRGGE